MRAFVIAALVVSVAAGVVALIIGPGGNEQTAQQPSPHAIDQRK